MKKLLCLACLSILVIALSGCGEPGADPAEAQKLKEGMSDTKFDINKVPEKDREKVKGFMGNGGAASATNSPSK